MTKEEANKKFAQEELAKILENINSNNQTIEDEQQITNIIDKAADNSCKQYQNEVKGEYYSKKEEKVINIVKTVAAIAICAGVIIYGSVKLGQMETAGDIQKEINRRITVQNIIGGSYSEEYVYSEEFRNYMNACGSEILIQEFNEAKQEMKETDIELSNPTTKDVIKYMENEYLEEHKGMVR